MTNRTMIKRVGRRGLKYRADRKAAKDFYVEYHGQEAPGAPCQSCGRMISVLQADFSHKIPAGRRANCNSAIHGIYSCRNCHQWLEHGPVSTQARIKLIESPVNMQTGGIVAWGPELGLSLMHWLAKANGAFYI